VEWHDKAYLIRFKYRELITRSVTAARPEIRGEHNSYAELKGQVSGSVPDTPKRSLGARRRFRGVRLRQFINRPVFDVSPSHDQGIGEQFFARKELTTISLGKAAVRVLHLDR
jgi:hypothetical protein